jgi:hypothetical protein
VCTGGGGDCCGTPPLTTVDLSAGCQRNRSGAGQDSRGSSGRSAQPHHTCRLGQLHRDRQARWPAASRLESTRPPDSMGCVHPGQARVSSVICRSLLATDLVATGQFDVVVRAIQAKASAVRIASDPVCQESVMSPPAAEPGAARTVPRPLDRARPTHPPVRPGTRSRSRPCWRRWPQATGSSSVRRRLPSGSRSPAGRWAPAVRVPGGPRPRADACPTRRRPRALHKLILGRCLTEAGKVSCFGTARGTLPSERNCPSGEWRR